MTSGIEPLGFVRRSQLISSYGIGAIIDLPKGSYMPMGLEDWEPVTGIPALVIGEPRLQAQLGVAQFRAAPISEASADGRVDPGQCAPAVRFPAWHECPVCHRIGTEGDPFRLAADGSQLECAGHAPPIHTTPVRFVLACRQGHIDEFPWIWWAHRRRREGACARPRLFLRSGGRSAALSDLQLECRSEDCGAPSESLGGAFSPDSLQHLNCGGLRPWLFDRQPGCDQTVRALQRGASNIHFSVTASALSIPPVSDSLFQIVEDQWLTLSALPAEAVDIVLASLASQMGVPFEALRGAFRERRRFADGNADRSDRAARSEEYLALSAAREDPVVAGAVPQFQNAVYEPPDELSAWFDLVGCVSRLREVRALAGFSRIEPFPVSGERISDAIRDGKIAPLSRTPRHWLPATELRGEGIFLRFRGDAIEDWIQHNPGVVERASVLDQRSAAIAADRGFLREYRITPRLLLVHSFSHALIRTISIECGYSSSALRERLYVSEPIEGQPAMHGVLIYTGSPDSEGSLGGLVRIGESERLAHVVLRTVADAEWCGSDPVCIETDPRQAGDRVSGAACHCCLLIPETACEKFNRELDRTMLVGSEHWTGFFGGAED